MSHEIIIGFDGSEQAHDALALGGRLADATGGKLLVAPIYPHDPIYEVYGYSDLERGAKDHAHAVLDEARAALGSRQAETIVRGASSPARGLHDLADTRGAAVIVVGSTHHSRIGRVAPGSVGRQLLSGSPCAVAVAPKGFAQSPRREGIETIVVAFDGSLESRHALHSAVGIAHDIGARIDLVGVVISLPHPLLGTSYAITTGKRTFSERLQDDLRRRLDEGMETVPARCRGTVGVHLGDPVDVLVERSGDADLLVCGSRGYGRGRQVLLGSTSAKMVDRALCPLLVVPRGTEVRVDDLRAGALEAEPTPSR